ncbi:hypothetical protein GCM10022254_61560 [Actinomadura meridiana]|uniref:Uncharacterized protein n=1 Tax=Actinomadura meridiana TaxID=559626 RepID=A0ABP8CIJ7_9ACTN
MPSVIATGMYTTSGDVIRMAGAFGIVAVAFLLFGLLLGALWGTRRRSRPGRHVAGPSSTRGGRAGSRRDVIHGVPGHAHRWFGPGQR